MSDKAGSITIIVFVGLVVGTFILLFSPREHIKGTIVEINSARNYSYALLDGGRIIRYSPGEDGHNMIRGVGDSIEGYIQFSGNVTIQKVFRPDTIKVVK